MDDLHRPDGTRVAVRCRDGAAPAILFLPGFASDMAGTKTLALDAWAAREGRAMIRFDYGGCGESGGAFEVQALDDWLDDALAVIDASDGPLILVGSSMGGWLMLLAALARPERIHALVGIAAAPDFTDWGYDNTQKAAFARGEDLAQPSPYGPPLVTTAALWRSGQVRLLLGGEIAIDCPVRLLQGQRDADVPWDKALGIAARLRSHDVQVILVKDGDHRLSRERDLALLIRTLESL